MIEPESECMLDSRCMTGERVMTVADIESRLNAVEAEVAALREALYKERVRAGIRIGREQVAQGQVRPAREALEELRQKHNIPRT